MSDNMHDLDALSRLLWFVETKDSGYSARDAIAAARAILASDWLAERLAKAWDEGNRHEAEYLDTWGQFDPNPVNPYGAP